MTNVKRIFIDVILVSNSSFCSDEREVKVFLRVLVTDLRQYIKIVLIITGRCGAGRAEFEKVTGYELQGQREYPLLRGHNPGLAVQCSNQCKSDPRCHGFNMNYKLNDCTALEGDADPTRIDIRQVPGIAYFEGICLRGGELILYIFIKNAIKSKFNNILLNQLNERLNIRTSI